MPRQRRGRKRPGDRKPETPSAIEADSDEVVLAVNRPSIEETDPRLVAIVRALARQAARDYLQQQSCDTDSRRLAPHSDGEAS